MTEGTLREGADEGASVAMLCFVVSVVNRRRPGQQEGGRTSAKGATPRAHFAQLGHTRAFPQFTLLDQSSLPCLSLCEHLCSQQAEERTSSSIGGCKGCTGLSMQDSSSEQGSLSPSSSQQLLRATLPARNLRDPFDPDVVLEYIGEDDRLPSRHEEGP